jgi:glycosyltransferase involved in cell wall biosynthesis
MISVIIPTYNRASYLKEAMASVLEEDFFCRAGLEHSFELLIIDDGSDDNTREVVESFGKKAICHYQPHQGVSAARNLGLKLSCGDFIAFLDSDDLWRKEKIGTQMSIFRTFPEAKVCYTEEIWIRRGVHLNPRKNHQKYPIYFISAPLIIKRGGHPDQLSHPYWGMDRFRVQALEKALGRELTSW